MTSTPPQIQELAAAAHDEGSAPSVTARQLISWFGAARRGSHVVAAVRRALRSAGVTTSPDFEYAYIDEPLTVTRVIGGTDAQATAELSISDLPVLVGAANVDPTYRIGKLESANKRPVSVAPQATLAEAVTIMLYHNYSQLPVMQGERDLRGAVSWRSVGRKLALQRACAAVRDCMEEATVIGSDTSLFAALPTIVDKQYVFVRDGANRIAGIVTTTDLSLQFRQLAEPFLLLGEIENHLRRVIDGKFTPAELAAVKDPADVGRTVADLADLTFGEYVRLLENPARWQALQLPVDRGVFVSHLSEVREIRNGVMHFDPDGVDPEELAQLRSFTRLLASLHS